MARLTRRARLLKPDEFKFVFENGRREHTPYFTAVAANSAASHPRLGLAIAKKNLALAVERNRIKRQIRESFRQHQASLPPLDIVILAKSVIRNEPAAQIRQQLERLWTRLAAR